MICCSSCFQNAEIIAIITKLGNIGTCPVCGASQSFLYDTEKDSDLEPLFEDLLSVYTPLGSFPDETQLICPRPLSKVLKEDWSIFSEDISEEIINSFLKAVAPNISHNLPTLFSENVDIWEKYDDDYLRQHSILHTAKWSDFVEAIKHKNRFHTNLIDTNILRDYCIEISRDIVPGKQRYYRGRIAKDNKGYTPKKMGAPPPENATDGRANSAGISRLYLTDNRETTFHEIRAAEFDYVTVGTFRLRQPIKVVNLTNIGNISPFGESVDCTALAINREHLHRINQEMGRTMRRGDSSLDYLPTQYICDFVMSILDKDGRPMFDGIQFQSAMHKEGSNLTIFYPEKFECTYCRTYEITKLNYDYQ